MRCDSSEDGASLSSRSRSTSVETFELEFGGESAPRGKIVILQAQWNGAFLEPVVRAARDALDQVGASYEVVLVPGALDLVAAARAVLRGAPAAVICFGLLLPGASDSYARTCHAVSNGLMRINAKQDVPVVNGVLMCQSDAQALERTHGPKNPGHALAQSALYMAKLQDADSCGDWE